MKKDYRVKMGNYEMILTTLDSRLLKNTRTYRTGIKSVTRLELIIE